MMHIAFSWTYLNNGNSWRIDNIKIGTARPTAVGLCEIETVRPNALGLCEIGTARPTAVGLC